MLSINLSFRKASGWFKAATILAGVIFFIYCLTGPMPKSLPQQIGREGMISLGILILAISLWLADIMHSAFVGFVCCVLLYSVGRFTQSSHLLESSFAGFGNSVVWFVFSGLIIGCGMMQSGLSNRLYLKMLQLTKNTYRSLVLIVLLFSVVLVFFIPSTDGRTIMLLSLVMGLSNLSSPDGGNPLRGISLMIPVCASILGIGALSSISAFTTAALVEKYMGIVISYTQWVLYFLPAEIVAMVVIYHLVLRIFPCDIKNADLRDTARQELAKMGPLSIPEKKSLCIIGLAILFWITGFATGIRPDVVAMLCAVLLILPGIGFLKRKDLTTKLNWLVSPLFLGMALSIVDSLNKTGMLEYIGNNLFSLSLDQATTMHPLQVMIILCVIAAAMHFLSAHSSVLIASFMPLVLVWTMAQGLGLFVPLAFVWGVQIQFMVYQSGAITAAFGYGQFSALDCIRLNLPLAVFQMFGGTTILYFWWKLLGLV